MCNILLVIEMFLLGLDEAGSNNLICYSELNKAKFKRLSCQVRERVENSGTEDLSNYY